MPSAKITYAKELRETEHWSRLYAYWKRIHRSSDSLEFEHFRDFFNWAMANGYTIGAKLFRRDEDEPYSPENCYWVPRHEWAIRVKDLNRKPDLEQKWDATVNRIRLYYGMEPIHSSEV